MEDKTGDVRSNEELTAAAAGGLRWMSYVRIVVELGLLGSMIVLARLIPPAEFGVFAVVIIVQELALTMPMEGIGSALVQRKTVDREHLQGGMVLSLGVGIILALLTLAAAPTIIAPVLGHRTAELLMLATPYYLLGGAYAVPVAQLRRRLDFRRLSIIDLTLNLTRGAATIIFALGGLDAEALVLGNMAGMAAALALSIAYAPPPLPRWRPQAMRDLLPYGGPAALACISWTGFRNGDYAIVSAQLGTAQAGFYWRGYQLAVEYQRKISQVMTQMAFPLLARAGSGPEMMALRRRMVQLLTVVLFPMLATLVLLAPVLVPWLFGARWEPAVLPTQILALGGATMLVNDTVGSALMAEGRARALLGFGVAQMVVYVAAILLVAHRGLAAISIAASVVHLLFLVVAYQVLLRDTMWNALRALGGDLAPALCGCVGLVALAGPMEWLLAGADAAPVAHVVLVSAVGAIGYLAVLRLWFKDTYGDLASAVGRLVPGRLLKLRPRRATNRPQTSP